MEIPIELLIEEERQRREQHTQAQQLQLELPVYDSRYQTEVVQENETPEEQNRGVIVLEM